MQPLCTWEGAYCHKITGHKITPRKVCEKFAKHSRTAMPLSYLCGVKLRIDSS
jgi:hypothetical protein